MVFVETAMERSVDLRELPQHFQFPDEFSDRYWFDSTRRCLCFRGFMSKATFDRIIVLSSDRKYQLAVEELFRRCSKVDEPQGQRRSSIKIGVLCLVLVLLCGTGTWLVKQWQPQSSSIEQPQKHSNTNTSGEEVRPIQLADQD